MKKILLTGGSGLLSLNWAISSRDCYDIVLGLHKRDVILGNVKSQKIQLDSVKKFNDDLSLIQPDFVINTVALTNVEQCESDYILAKHVNVVLSANVAEACSDNKIPLVHISTDHLFTGNNSYINEECLPSPLNHYGKTKALAEKIVLIKNNNALVIRTNFFGWGTSYRQSFSDKIIQTLRAGQNISLFKDVYFTPILISQLAKIVNQLLEKNIHGIFNVVGDERISKYNFGMKIAEVFNLNTSLIQPIEISKVNYLIRRPSDMSLSNKKVSKELTIKLGNIDYQLHMLHQQEDEGFATELRNV